MTDSNTRRVPIRIVECENFLLDLMRSVEGVRKQIAPSYSSGRKDQLLDSNQNIPTEETMLQRLYSSLRSQNIPIECRICSNDGTEGSARAFISAPPLKIVMCANRLSTKDYAEAFTHEATHAFDYVHGSCDFSTCDGLAYSEVRAARNAECSKSWPFLKEHCIKRYATRATSNLFPKDAPDCVARVFEKAMTDTKPQL